MDNSLLKLFGEWLSGKVTPETARDYVGVVKRGMWPPSRRAHVRAWRKYVEFLSSRGLIDYLTKMTYLDYLKLGGQASSKTQKKIPDTLVLDIKHKLEELGLGQLFILGLGGARLSHVVEALNTWSPSEVVKHPTDKFEPRLYCSKGWCRYYLGVMKGRKRCDYIYYPNMIVGKQQLSYRQLKDRLHHHGIEFKMLRKWAEQQLTELAHEHNIPLDAVKLIMSRGLTVSGIHYLNTRDWADKLFNKYVEWLRENNLI